MSLPCHGELGLDRYVTFTGFLYGDELLAQLCTLDIGVIPDPPNGCNEKLSMNKVFEYMALGIPFVQFDLAQSRREAKEGALIVDRPTPVGLAEGIICLLADEDRRAQMSAYSAQRAEREFRWANEKASLLAAYEAVLGAEPSDVRKPTARPEGVRA